MCSAWIKKEAHAFTLAEVLITLGIIGVVAAMTIPTVINATNGAQYKTAFKKALSVMAQAVEMNKALNDYDLSEVIRGTQPTDRVSVSVLDGEAQTLYSVFKNNLNVVRVARGQDFGNNPKYPHNFYPVLRSAKDDNNEAFRDYQYFISNHTSQDRKFANPSPAQLFPGISKSGNSNSWPTGITFLFLNDGITLIFDNGQRACRKATANYDDNYCLGFIDVNGQKGPNKLVDCDKGSEVGDFGTDDYTCTVSNPTDIYPVAMYNSTIIPASAAARAVLFSK